MATYLLLRNNKESGPYSVDDLMSMGLKAYDLVWVQGKSAAWRYPSEVDELKPFAPVVEEQPFDRFFKKQTDTKKEEVPKEEIPVVPPEYEKYIPKKSVFVTMPGQNTQSGQSLQKPVYAQTIKKEEPVPAPQYSQPVQAVQQTIIVSENPAAAQVKYSQPLDEIKEMYVKTLYDRKQKIARKGFWLQSLKKAAVVLLFVAIGVIAGFIIKSNGNKEESLAEKTAASSSQIAKTEPATQPVNTVTDTAGQQQVLPAPNGGYINKEPEKQAMPETKEIEKPAILPDTKKEKAIMPSQKEENGNVQPQGVDIDPATGERSRKVRSGTSSNTTTPAELKNNSISSEVADLVSVSTNEYKKVAFGGIRNLELTVTNDSKFVLDNVIVELQYLKPNELPLKTENIEFKSVAPRATATIKIPDTNRGIKVTYRIINIKSRQMDEVAKGY